MYNNWTDGFPPVVSNIMILLFFNVAVVYKLLIFNIVNSLQLHAVKKKFTYFIKNGSVFETLAYLKEVYKYLIVVWT